MAPGPGGYVVVVNGRLIGTFADLNQAQNFYNSNGGPTGPPPPAPTATPPPPPAPPPAPTGAPTMPVAYNAAYENTQLGILQANIQAAYNNAVVKGANQQRALEAANNAAQVGANLIKTYGDQAVQTLQQATTAGLGVADLLARLQGPSNAFAYDRAIQGVGANGLSNSINALTGDQRPTSFGAMGSTPGAMSLATMGAQTAAAAPATQDLNGMVAGLGGKHLSITDQLLGISQNAVGNLAKVNTGQLPFSMPKFDPGGSGSVQ